MRKLIGAIGAIAMLCVASLPAAAATVTGGTLSITIGALPGVTVSQSPDPLEGLDVAPDGSFTHPAGLFATTNIIDPNLFTGVPLISSLTIQASNLTGTFGPGLGNAVSDGVFIDGQGFSGPMGLAGGSTVGVLGGLIKLDIPFSSVGVGGTPVMAGAAALKITVTGANWTTGQAQLTGITTTITTPEGASQVLNTVTFTGGITTTPNGDVNLTLVSPIRILTNAAGNLPAVNVLSLTIVPEPGTLLLLGAGIGGLVVFGRRRLRG